MRISLECGLLEAGLAACITSFCLSPCTAFSQLPEKVTPVSTLSLDTTAVQRIEQQQQALFDTIQRIQQDSETALNRYTDTVLTQFNLLQESFTTQQTRDIAAAEQLNRFARNLVIVMIAGMVLSVLVIAWIPLWATSRMTRQIMEFGRIRPLLASNEPLEASVEIESAIKRLEQRLLTLETEPPKTAAESDTSGGDQPPPPAAKTPMTPRVALAVGDSSALMFLPRDVEAPPWAGFRRQVANLKKFWTRARAHGE